MAVWTITISKITPDFNTITAELTCVSGATTFVVTQPFPLDMPIATMRANIREARPFLKEALDKALALQPAVGFVV